MPKPIDEMSVEECKAEIEKHPDVIHFEVGRVTTRSNFNYYLEVRMFLKQECVTDLDATRAAVKWLRKQP